MKTFSELVELETARLKSECVIQTANDVINSLEYVMAMGRNALNPERMRNVIVYQRLVSTFFQHEKIYREAGRQPIINEEFFQKFVEAREDAARHLANIKYVIELIDLLPPDFDDNRAQWLIAVKSNPMFAIIRQAAAMQERLEEQDALYIKIHAEHGLSA